MKRTVFLKIAATALLLLNLLLIGFIFWTRPPAPDRAARFLIEKTGFDDAQQARYRSLIEQHRTAQRLAGEQSRAATDRFYSLLGKKTIADSEAVALLDSVMAFRRREEAITFEHFTEVRKLCRPDQAPKFDAAISEALKALRPRPPK